MGLPTSKRAALSLPVAIVVVLVGGVGVSSAFKLGGSPSRHDIITVDSTSAAALVSLQGATIIDTGLHITADSCNSVQTQPSALYTALKDVREIRGTLEIEKGNCMTSLNFFEKLAVVRGDFARDGITVSLSGGFSANDFPVLETVVGEVHVNDAKVTFAPSLCPECGDAGCVPSGACCSSKCLGGCDENTGTCVACAEGYLRTSDDECTLECPQGHKKYGIRIKDVSSYAIESRYPAKCGSFVGEGQGQGGWARDQHFRYCVSECPSGLYLNADQDECVTKCPGLVYPVNGICPSGYDGTVCDVVFDGQEDSEGAYIVVNSKCHVEVLEPLNCNTLNGSLRLIKSSDILSDLNSLNVFKKIERFGGDVSFLQTPIPSFDFLANVKSIAACSDTPTTGLPFCSNGPTNEHFSLYLTSRYPALSIRENAFLKSLSLLNLKKIGGPGANMLVRIEDNMQLCLHDTIHWADLTKITDDSLYSFKFTAEFLESDRMILNLEGYTDEQRALFLTAEKHPFLCSPRSCPSLCAGRGCWDDENTDSCQLCVEENNLVRDGECIVGDCEVGDPSPGYFLEPGTELCKPCHESCDDCSGPLSDDCIKCVGEKVLLPDQSCVDSCGRGYYPDEDNVCQECTPGCLECLSATECLKCDVTPPYRLYLDGRKCVPKTGCPDGTYPADNLAECTPCDGKCKTCDSFGPNSCLSCYDDDIYFKEVRRCDSTCPSTYYIKDKQCEPCHPLCESCFGSESTQCTTCREGYPKLGNTTCVGVGECPPGMFSTVDLDTGIPACNDCTPNCHTCAGSKRFAYTIIFCTRCMRTTYLSPFDFTCNATCPAETYGSGDGDTDRLCLDCDQCTDSQYASVACSHETNRVCNDCTVCSSTQYQFAACGTGLALGFDTICLPQTVCTSLQYESVAATATSDRECKNLTVCDSDIEIENVTATATSDRVCTNKVCLPGGNGYERCKNGGECRPVGAGFRCICPPDRCGDFCDLTFDEDQVCGTGQSASSSGEAVITTGVIAAVIVVAALLISLLAFGFSRRQITKEKNKYFEAFKKGEEIPEDEWEINRAHLTIGEEIGSGHFGQVNKAMYKDPRGSISSQNPGTMVSFGSTAMEVAVKSLKVTNSDYGIQGFAHSQMEDPRHHQAAKDFFDEMKLMKEIKKHHNVISLIGVCTREKPYLIVTEFAKLGDLRHFLMDRRATADKPARIDSTDMLNFSIQIANGMFFLSTRHKIVHRDLAARNVLVAQKNKEEVMKISDFGLARDVYEEDFYQKNEQGQMAIKWMAPEALADRIFTTFGDVWSFGIVMWEIASFGQAPYPGYGNSEVLPALLSGHRMPPPRNCARGFYNVMLRCWKQEPSERPSFQELRTALIDMSQFSDARLLRILGDDVDERVIEFGEFNQTTADSQLTVAASYYEVAASSTTSSFRRQESIRSEESVAGFGDDDDAVMYELATDEGAAANPNNVILNPGFEPYAEEVDDAPMYNLASNGIAVEEEVDEAPSYTLASDKKVTSELYTKPDKKPKKKKKSKKKSAHGI